MIKASQLQTESANQATERQNTNKPQCDEGKHLLIIDNCLFYNIVGQDQRHNIDRTFFNSEKQSKIFCSEKKKNLF